jgi:hypothetical protein
MSLEDIIDLASFLSHEVNRFVYHMFSAMMCHHRPKAMGSIGHQLKPPVL